MGFVFITSALYTNVWLFFVKAKTEKTGKGGGGGDYYKILLNSHNTNISCNIPDMFFKYYNSSSNENPFSNIITVTLVLK